MKDDKRGKIIFKNLEEVQASLFHFPYQRLQATNGNATNDKFTKGQEYIRQAARCVARTECSPFICPRFVNTSWLSLNGHKGPNFSRSLIIWYFNVDTVWSQFSVICVGLFLSVSSACWFLAELMRDGISVKVLLQDTNWRTWLHTHAQVYMNAGHANWCMQARTYNSLSNLSYLI